MQSASGNTDLQQIYERRFRGMTDYRTKVWKTLAPFFARWVPENGSVLDLGAGYCEFINSVQAKVKYAMDLNPSIHDRAGPEIRVLSGDCTAPWPLPGGHLDTVFTSNFLEHLPDKAAISTVLTKVHRHLKPGGAIVAMGPNIRYVAGAYWDFFDHHVALTELSLAEALANCGFEIEEQVARFLPFTMSHGPEYPVWALRFYLATPAVWPLFGKQFLVVGRKPRMTP